MLIILLNNKLLPLLSPNKEWWQSFFTLLKRFYTLNLSIMCCNNNSQIKVFFQTRHVNENENEYENENENENVLAFSSFVLLVKEFYVLVFSICHKCKCNIFTNSFLARYFLNILFINIKYFYLFLQISFPHALCLKGFRKRIIKKRLCQSIGRCRRVRINLLQFNIILLNKLLKSLPIGVANG